MALFLYACGTTRLLGFLTSLWRDGEAIAEKTDRDFTVDAPDDPGVYRITIRDPNRPAAPPWMFGNPIYIQAAERTPPSPRPAAATMHLSLFDDHSTAGWTKESDSMSLSAIEVVQMISATELRLRYGLAGGSPIGQYCRRGGRNDTRSSAITTASRFTIRSEHPMRISIQVRAEVANAPPERWQRSIYIDATDGERSVSLRRHAASRNHSHSSAVRENVRAIMFIVDTTNSKPGASGRIWIKNVRLER